MPSLLCVEFPHHICNEKQLFVSRCNGGILGSLLCGTQLSLCRCCHCTVSLSPCARHFGSKPQTRVSLALLAAPYSTVCHRVGGLGTRSTASSVFGTARPALSDLLTLRSAILGIFWIPCVSVPCQRSRGKEKSCVIFPHAVHMHTLQCL